MLSKRIIAKSLEANPIKQHNARTTTTMSEVIAPGLRRPLTVLTEEAIKELRVN